MVSQLCAEILALQKNRFSRFSFLQDSAQSSVLRRWIYRDEFLSNFNANTVHFLHFSSFFDNVQNEVVQLQIVCFPRVTSEANMSNMSSSGKVLRKQTK